MNTILIRRIFLIFLFLVLEFSMPSFADENSLQELELQKKSQGLTKDCFKGKIYSINPYDIDLDSDFVKRLEKKYSYLKKAFEISRKNAQANAKYIFIYDKSIDKKKFDMIKISIPQGANTLRITQVSDPFIIGDFTYELFLFPKDSLESYKRASTRNILNTFYEENGILQKTVDIDSVNYKDFVYVVTNYSSKKNYALIFEFFS